MGRKLNRGQSVELDACIEAVDQRQDRLLQWLTSDDPAIRAATALLLASASWLSGKSIPLLTELWNTDSNAIVLATTLLALEQLDESGVWRTEISRIVKDGHCESLVWGVATLSWLRHLENACANGVAGIEAWLGSQLNGFERVTALHLTSRSEQSARLVSVLKLRGKEPSPATLQALVQVTSRIKTDLKRKRLEAVIDSVLNIPRNAKVLPVAQLTPNQRLVAEGLAHTHFYPLATWMPTSGEPRLKWLGQLPPGPLDRMMKITLEDKERSLPAWQAWNLLSEDDATRTHLIPKQLWDQFSPLERWEAAIEYHARFYGSESFFRDWDILTEFAKTVQLTTQLEQRALIIGQSIIERAGYLDDPTDSPGYGDPVTSRLLLYPFVLAGRKVPEPLEPLLWIEDWPEEHEIMKAVRREALENQLSAMMDRITPTSAAHTVEHVLLALSLAPSPALCEQIVAALSLPRSEDTRSELQQHCRKAAESIPALAAALDTPSMKPSGTKKAKAAAKPKR